MIVRAYSILNVKSVDAAQRTLSGWATTPELDRQGDQIDQFGCTFKNPLPLLWMHQADQPVGTVALGKANSTGIPFSATIAKIDEPGTLKDRCDLAWQSVHARLVSAVSVGFRPLDNAVEPIKGGGLKFLKTEIMELSLVSIPANQSCTITNVKSAAMAEIAAMRTQSDGDSAIAKSTETATVGFVARGMRNFATMIGKNVKERILQETTPLQARIEALEQRPLFEYAGVWKPDEQYVRGQFISFDGSLWHTNCTTTARPGTSSDHTLAVKHGRDLR